MLSQPEGAEMMRRRTEAPVRCGELRLHAAELRVVPAQVAARVLELCFLPRDLAAQTLDGSTFSSIMAST
jgi:hypothetical protein